LLPLVLAACSARAGETQRDRAVKLCASLFGMPAVPSRTPADARKLVALAVFPVRPVGLLWYEGNLDEYTACAYTNDADGCGYSTHQFKLHAGHWAYAPADFKNGSCRAR
jgi:hypothetical protein